MEFLRCNECKDLVALRLWKKKCKCKLTRGRYLRDQETVEVEGPCEVITGKLYLMEEPNVSIRRVSL